MRVRVNVRLNTRTGEVELFQVDDVDAAAGRRGDDHEAEHDRIAGELGGVMARSPGVVEVLPDEPPPVPGGRRPWLDEEPDDRSVEPQRQRDR
ncbi:hypothetical protein ACFRAR_08080 [Kitasatospora sp. NPDC056651]|uniref:hypothetical protein n=1 Tax=Kitasatospora sp. NPDC056651 TaxID=3345892 RepID=UPI00369C92AA